MYTLTNILAKVNHSFKIFLVAVTINNGANLCEIFISYFPDHMAPAYITKANTESVTNFVN